MASVANEKKKLAEARAALGDSYVPDENEEYMNQRQQDYFRMLLLDWKKSIHDAAGQTLQSLQDGPIREPDLNDRASSETDWGIELRTRDRQRKLISKIDSAPYRTGRIWLVRSDRRSDRPQAADCPPRRHHDRRSPGSARAPREDLPRRLDD
jgi:hypothetical protein